MKPTRTWRAAMASSCAIALIAPFALAQEAPSQDDALKLTSVTVTATKREENIKDVPVSLTSLDETALATYGQAGEDIQFLTARVPSLIIETSFGRIFPRPYIRGLGNTDFDFNASQPVSFIYDEIVYENPVLKGFPVFDTARVEVLRGPQGTLFGRNTPAGALKFESVKPGDELDAYARASYGTFGTTNVEGAVGGPVSDKVSLRLSGVFQRRDDYIETALPTGGADAGGYEDLAWRAQAKVEVTDNLTWLGNLHGRTLDGGQVSFQANAFQTGSAGPRPGFDREENFADAQANSTLETDALGFTSRADWELSAATLTYLFGYETVETFSRGDVDGGAGAAFLPTGSTPGLIPFPAESADGIDDHQQITHELRLSNGEDADLRWTAGLYAFNEEIDISSRSYNTLAGGAENGTAFQTQNTDSLAVFGSLAYDLTESLTGQVGLRYTDESKDLTARRTLSPFGAPNIAPPTVDVGDEQLSWDASLTYALNGDTNVYGRIARGFRAPSIQGRLVFGDVITTADSEILDSYEAGLKTTLLDGRLDANLAAYTYTVEDLQLTAIGGAGNFNQLLNAEEGKGYGFEADIRALLMEGLAFSAGLSYNNTEINDADLTVGICGSPCTVRDPIDPVTGGARIDGNAFPQAPEWIGNFAFDYTRDWRGGEIFASTDWSYRSDSNIFLYESVEFTAEGRWEGGAALGYRKGPWSAKAFVRNLTDEIGTVSAIDFNNLTGIFNQPRIYGIELGWTM
ncbi:TonB-dependent receptor [Hyphomonas sp.]|uniref:TonB-dependent receptor n=1 Tax=Hyphomonas sp. TaxID=87 RepID=UPI000A7A1DD1|nr:TonB-dependent receptor [Hyphomonas sp.]MBA4338379.1 TonB-dependent receptor [Hyphomonas sp.]